VVTVATVSVAMEGGPMGAREGTRKAGRGP
jgi:hypothetical protein